MSQPARLPLNKADQNIEPIFLIRPTPPCPTFGRLRWAGADRPALPPLT